nr:hypothetical protein [Tanacetum cinerariifolium]
MSSISRLMSSITRRVSAICVPDAYEYSAAIAVSSVSGAETRVHTPAPGESRAQNGLPNSILSSEPKPLVHHMPHPPQSIWSPVVLSCPP